MSYKANVYICHSNNLYYSDSYVDCFLLEIKHRFYHMSYQATKILLICKTLVYRDRKTGRNFDRYQTRK